MDELTVTFDGKTFAPPKSWNDLKRKQYLKIFSLLCARNKGALTHSDGLLEFHKIEVTRAIIGLTDQDLEAWKAKLMAENEEDGEYIFLEQLKTISEAFSAFLYEKDEEGKVSVRCDFTRLPYRTLKSRNKKGVTLHGPADELDNLTFGELAECFTLYEAYLQDQDESYVDRLLAVLYRPHKPKSKKNIAKNYGGDVRLPYLGYEATVDHRIRKMKGLPQVVRSLLLFWFGCCRKTIIDRYANIFEAPVEGKTKRGNDYGYGGLMLSLAGGVVHLDKVSAQPFDNVFTHLSMLQDKANQAEWSRAMSA
ncbi:MAG: hypothetical protein AAFY91_04390 [Bacteroidota bacterium]